MNSGIDVKDLRKALITAGLEVFRVRGEEVHLAVRHNVQLMEAGVRVRAGTDPSVTVVMHSQRNDAPTLPPERLFDCVRDRSAPLRSRGYAEVAAAPREIKSVNDTADVLDVWYELTLLRKVASLEEAVSEAQAAIATERYVIPEG